MFTKKVAILVSFRLQSFVGAYFALEYLLFGQNAPAFFTNTIALFVWLRINVFVITIGTFVNNFIGVLIILRLRDTQYCERMGT
jgi:hypothetical protein